MSRSSSIAERALSRRALLRGGTTLSLLAMAPKAFARHVARNGPARLAASPRLQEAYDVRVRAAAHARDAQVSAAVVNGDDVAVADHAACYSKGLPHDRIGRVDAKAYDAFLKALHTHDVADLEAIPLGGFLKLANPEAAWAFDLVGPDASQPVAPPPPRFASDEQGAELAELYWQALARDVPFANYDADPIIRRAAEELSSLPGYAGPKDGERVTPAIVFRGTTGSDRIGPYVSQFLAKELPILPMRVDQRVRTAVPARDYVTRFDEWLGIQNGKLAEPNRFDDKTRYIRNGRDLGEYVHRDFTYQAFLGACLLALRIGTLVDGANPYKHSRTQSPFVTFGQPYLLYLLAVVTQTALKACWHQKWLVHRRLRPEELAGRVEAHLRGIGEFPLPRNVLNGAALDATRSAHGSALLPLAYPEGCPAHPSYPAAHAVIAGACATVLKALLDESNVIPDPVVATSDGLSLSRWTGTDLTVGGELDKLAFNIAMGRNFGGVHWRSDASAGLRFGEAVAIAVLEEMRLTGAELAAGWSFRSFDGQPVRTT